MSCAASNALGTAGSGALRLPAGAIGDSVERLQRGLGRHVGVIVAPRAAHDWILQVFRDQLRPIEGAHHSALCRDALARLLRSGIGVCRVAIPRGYPDEWLGWLATVDGGAIYLYVRSRWRRAGIGTALVRNVQPEGNLGLAYWTGEAAEAAVHGMPIQHSIGAYQALLAFKRKGNP